MTHLFFSDIVRMGADGQLVTSQVKSIDAAVSASAMATAQMTNTTKISYDQVDVGVPAPPPPPPPPLVGGAAFGETTTVTTKTIDGAYTNYGYDNRENLEMSTFKSESATYDNTETMGISGSSTTTTEATTSGAIQGAVVGGTVITGAVTGAVAGGSTTTVTKETTTLDASHGAVGTVMTDMRTINAGGTPTVLRKIIKTTTTVTEEVIEEPAPEASGVVITEISGDASAQPLAIDQRY
jgi:hypothetical protein